MGMKGLFYRGQKGERAQGQPTAMKYKGAAADPEREVRRS